MITETPELLVDWDVVDNTTIRSRETDFQCEIGDAQQAPFYPQFKILRFNNEFNFSIRPVLSDYSVTQLRTINEKVQCRIGIWDFRFWVGTEENDEGVKSRGTRFEMRINAQPPSNTLGFSVNQKGCEMHMQLPLSQSQIDEGRVRPAPVEYSIAIRTSKKNNQYGTGKLCHLYRPRLVDANNNRAWGRWIIISQGLIQLQMPPAFLASATYPVRIR